MRAMSLAAREARSLCAAAAVLCSVPMPAERIARSAFFDTVASPLVRIAGVIVDDTTVAEGDPVRTTGRLIRVKTAATTSEHATAMPTVMSGVRIWQTQRRSPRWRNARASLLAGPAGRIQADVRHGTGAPVVAVPPLHQLFIDEVAAQRPEVRVPAGDDAVHLGLGVDTARLEVLDQPAQHDQSLLVLHRNGRQPSRPVDEVV